MKTILIMLLMLCCRITSAQLSTISGYLQDDNQLAIPFANVILYSATDSSLVKLEITNEEGFFLFKAIPKGAYSIVFSSMGYTDLRIGIIELSANERLVLGTNILKQSLEMLSEVTVTASRPLISIESDRTIMNVEGTINSAGSDVLDLLRKAPHVIIDNNDKIRGIGQGEVIVYINGKRLPLSGDNLSAYLRSISSEQIARLDIITKPGVSYDAEGNSGIIDIILKKDKDIGANGILNMTYQQGKYAKYLVNGSGNFRGKHLNIYSTISVSDNESFNNSSFDNYQNGLRLLETNNFKTTSQHYNLRLGADFFLSKHQTVGVMINGNKGTSNRDLSSRVQISDQNSPLQVDSLLVVNGTSTSLIEQQAYNLNYNFDNQKGVRLNIDLDYGKYNNDPKRYQPNEYFNNQNKLLFTEIYQIESPTRTDIYTFKIDFKHEFLGGKLGIGSKLSKIGIDNVYRFFDKTDDIFKQNNYRSRIFDYSEFIFANYISFSKPILDTWQLSIGLREEQTYAEGDLHAFNSGLYEPPVKLNYLNWFPSFGLTWKANKTNNYTINYSSRINRPNYLLLNPFTDQVTNLSYEKGNPYLKPEIANSLEMGYSHSAIYNFRIFYSHVSDKIIRLVGPDENNAKATYGTFENLGQQKVFGIHSNVSLWISDWFDTNLNFSASYINNQANFNKVANIDLKVFSYNIYSQNSFKLGNGFNAQLLGYYNGPNIFGGNFKMRPNWSIDLGLQRKFLKENLNVSLAAKDIFYSSGFNGVAEFDGLIYYGNGQRDSRNVSINLSYNLGNQNLKRPNRNQGLDSEQKRIEF